jgi:hypothetical protein
VNSHRAPHLRISQRISRTKHLIVGCIALVSTALAETTYTQPSGSGAGLTFDQVETLIQQQNPKSIEETLALFPKAAFDQYALVYSSRSLQGATPPNPRAIVFDKKSGLTFAFNGDSKEDGFNTLEFMQFDQNTKKFEFHEVTFSGGKAAISKPDTCLKCHGDNPHPIWDSYFLWPGVYGSEDADLVGDEKKNLEKWVAARAAHPRYQYLSVGAVSGLSTQTPDGHAVSLGAQNLGMNLSHQNFQALALELQSDLKLASFRYALIAAGACPDEPIDDFLPLEVKTAADPTFQKVNEQAEQAIKKSFTDRIDRTRSLDSTRDFEKRVSDSIKIVAKGGIPMEIDAISLIARYRYLVENFGSATPNWSLEFKAPGSNLKTYAMNDGYRMNGGLPDLWKELLSPVDDADLYAIFEAVPAYPTAPPASVCGKLKEKSLVALTKVKSGDQKSTPHLEALATDDKGGAKSPAISQVFNSCIFCHAVPPGSDTSFPQFPFNDAEKLKARLGETGYPNGTLAQEILFRISTKGDQQMPPSGGLSSAEIDTIKKFVDNLEH